MRAIETIVANFSGAFPNTLGINSTGPSTKDGTELIANLFNDYIGVFPQALLNHMSITPNGNAETATDSQQLDALIMMMARYGSAYGCTGRPDTDTLHDVVISAGSIPDSTRQYMMRLTSAIAKQGDVAWVAGGTPGTPAGGLMGGTWSANTEYGIFLIYNPTTKVLDAGFSVYTIISTIPTPTFLPAGYTIFQMVDWVKTDGSSQIIQTNTYDLGAGVIRKEYKTPTIDIARAGTLSTTRVLDTLPVPTGFHVKCYSTLQLYDATSSFYAYVWNPNITDVAPSAVNNSTHYRLTGTSIFENHIFGTNTLRQVAARADIATVDQYNLSVHTFEFKRF